MGKGTGSFPANCLFNSTLLSGRGNHGMLFQKCTESVPITAATVLTVVWNNSLSSSKCSVIFIIFFIIRHLHVFVAQEILYCSF